MGGGFWGVDVCCCGTGMGGAFWGDDVLGFVGLRDWGAFDSGSIRVVPGGKNRVGVSLRLLVGASVDGVITIMEASVVGNCVQTGLCVGCRTIVGLDKAGL